jgi:hypothetical protein
MVLGSFRMALSETILGCFVSTGVSRTSVLFLIFRYALPACFQVRSTISAEDGCSMRFASIHLGRACLREAASA